MNAQSPRPSVVYVVNPIKFDLSPARAFGTVRFINERYVFPDELTDQAEAGNELPLDVATRMQAAANSFHPQCDYVLIGGDHLQLVAFTAMLARAHPMFKVLRYDRQAEGYVPVCVRSVAFGGCNAANAVL